MGLFGKRTKRTQGKRRGACRCPEHVEALLDLQIPPESLGAGDDLGPSRVGDLLAEAVWVDGWQHGEDPADAQDLSDALLDGFTHYLELGDEVRAHYDDEAPLALDAALLAQPGIEEVAWEDRDVLHVRAPDLCADGVLAATVRALLDPRVRIST